jgi:ligand-binding sensor domain-containing protein
LICKWNSRRLPVVCGMLPLLLAGCGLGWAAQGQDQKAPVPAGPVLYTAAGDIKALTASPDGRLWAATGGGLLCWTSAGAQPRRWTAADGLGSNDVRAVAVDGDGLRVTTATGEARLDPMGIVTTLPISACGTARLVADGRQSWAVTPSGLVRQGDGRCLGWPTGMSVETVGNVTGLATDAGNVTLATSLGLWRWTAGHWHSLPLPSGSPASHVSALTPDAQGLLVGLYGDGVYRLTRDGQWRRLPGQPDACRRPTALAQTPDGVAVGTNAEGVWRERAGRWQACALPPVLPCADVNCLTAFQGSLWAGSFDGGLLCLQGTEGEAAQAVTRTDGLSSNSPRGLVVFGGTLYVRHADGQLDCSTDGKSWHPAFARSDLPRPEVYALATDTRRLLIGGWAGWAVTDGHTWELHYHDPELHGQVVTAIAAQGDAVWIGTQKRGLLCYRDGRYAAFQEPQGMTDDWVTSLAVQGDRLLVGTYTGGLLEKTGDRFAVRLQPEKFAIRAIAFDPDDGSALAATPLGLYREDTSHHWTLVDARRTGGLETQAVLPGTGGLWVAGRAGLAFIPRHDL